MKMKTGLPVADNPLPNSFYITMIGLNAILKRASFKDMALFKSHNPIYFITSSLFTAAIRFNLFSEYGIGKKLEPILEDVLKNVKINYENYKDNVYYQEVINLAPKITSLLYEGDAHKEAMWSYEYAISSLNKTDDLSSERFFRLYKLFYQFYQTDDDLNQSNEEMNDLNQSKEEINNLSQSNEEMNDLNQSNEEMNDLNQSSEEMNNLNQNSEEMNNLNQSNEEIKICVCDFCNEFRKYHLVDTDISADDIILQVIKEIHRRVNT